MDISEVDKFTVNEEDADNRIDKILTKRYKEVRSRTYFQFLIFNNHVLVNGSPIKKHFRPNVGDEIEVRFVMTPEVDLTPENIPLDVIFEDEHLIVVNKPSGMVVHPALGNWSGTFVNALLYHCNQLQGEFRDSDLRPGIVHRLDKNTSGVLIAAKESTTQQKLTELFSERKTQKEYIAVCCGNPGSGELETLIDRHPKQRKLRAVSESSGKQAITKYETLATDGKISVVKIRLITGRTHQIRVHMKYLGTPVLGDSSYGNAQTNKRFGVSRQLLHAYSLGLVHPITGEEVKFVADLPDDIQKYVQLLGCEV
ncbi:MAG: RluA family pseudouridine synthase [Chlamydiota bacterium]|nr:RluA family pseudouridine synthase [Chlamydiota bacterium]